MPDLQPPVDLPQACEWLIVAEPNPARAAEYARMLQPYGFDVTIVRNGPEVWPLLGRKPRPALLVVNLMLPMTDGLAVLRQLAGAHVDLPVIALTNVPALRNAAIETGLPRLGVLPTAFTPAEFERTAANLLHRASLQAPVPGPTVRRRPMFDAVQQFMQHLADDLTATFSPPLASVGLTLADQTWFALSSKPLIRLVDPVTPFAQWPVVRDAARAGELVVVPDVRQNPVFATTAWPPAGTFRGIAVAPLTFRSGAAVGAACLLDTEPLAMDAGSLQAFDIRARAASAELERFVMTESAARQLFSARRELEGARLEANARIAALSRIAMKDVLTGLPNRRAGEEAIARESARIQRRGARSTVLLLDVDHFKRINDTYGHQAGDRVLGEIAKVFLRLQRTSDLTSRWGGEEFLVLLPDVDLAGARRFGERVRSAVEQADFGNIGRVTISGGAAEMLPMESADLAIARADQALYKAKAAGRNRIG